LSLACNHFRLPNFWEKTRKTFDDARWILAIIWVAPKCWDTARLAWLCRGTWLMRILIKTI
jgi:hypothetical protein